MAAEVARKIYLEGHHEPDAPRAPILPSARQQELRNITHQPFQPWCEACVLGRSRQSPHAKTTPTAYGFTKQKHEVQEGELESLPWAGHGDAGGEEAHPDAQNEPNAEAGGIGEIPLQKPIDYRDQFGLSLVAAESTTLEKGAGSLKRVTEHLVRLSLQVTSVKQALDAVQACRSRLGLVTNTRLIEKGSASNGQVEKAIDTIRRGGLTVPNFLEDRRAAFLHNRFAVGSRGAPAFEIVFGRRCKGKLLPFGEKCIYYTPSKHKGDLQWEKGIWLGVNERNASHILGTANGVVESRSIRRLPENEQWDATMVLSAKGLPWSYMGTAPRKRPLYSSVGAPAPLLPDTATLESLARAAGKATAGEFSETWWDPEADSPPELTPEQLEQVDREADLKEITRLIAMGSERLAATTGVAATEPASGARVPQHVPVHAGTVCTGLYFSTLATVHTFISWAISENLQLTTVDVKDAYLNVPQPNPVTIQVDRAMFGEPGPGTITLVLDRLEEAKLKSYIKESTLFKSTEKGKKTGLILHADDGLLASTEAERQEFERVFGGKVTLQVSPPLVNVGDSIDFLKRRYVKTLDGVVAIYSNGKRRRMQENQTGQEFDAVLRFGVFGACKGLYLRDILEFIGNGEFMVELRSRSDSASARTITQRLGCGRVQHLQAGWLWIQDYVKRREISVGPIGGTINPADVGTKPLTGTRIRELLYTMGALEPGGDPYGKADKESGDEKRALSQAIKEFKSAGAAVRNIKTVLPVLLMLTQVSGVQGLGLAMWTAGWNDELATELVATAAVGLLVLAVFVGLPLSAFKLLKWSWKAVFQGRRKGSRTVGTQTEEVRGYNPHRGMSKEERLFSEEYVRRCTDLEQLLAQKCREEERYSDVLAEVRDENRRLQQAFERLRARREPETIHVATSRGVRFHLPGCGHIRWHNVQEVHGAMNLTSLSHTPLISLALPFSFGKSFCFWNIDSLRSRCWYLFLILFVF
ncbi:AGD9 [Symbiodinium sp. CCMP2592]|nr:AGD9 [Symbiodinium sp. CCMP2592]